MSRSTNKLTEAAIRNAKPQDKPYKLVDGDGMHLLIKTNGGKYWRFDYRFTEKQKTFSIGVYPDISLAAARKAREKAREQLRVGIDPNAAKKQDKQQALLNTQNTFEIITKQWIDHKSEGWTPSHAAKVIKTLEKEAFPILGKRDITTIKTPIMLAMLKAIESRGVYVTTGKVKQWCASIFRYAIGLGLVEYDPTHAIKEVLRTRPVKHMARISEAELPDLMANIRQYDSLHGGDVITRLALQFMTLTFVRTSELINTPWQEIDFDKSEWRIPAERMKMDEPHIVPLSTQALAVLQELQQHTGTKPYIFASPIDLHKPISNNTMIYALYRMGYKGRMTGHGFRGLASTILNEQGFRPDVIERQLAHSEQNEIRAAYNHAQYLPERKAMMQHWSDYLDGLQVGNVVSVRFGGVA